MDENGANLKECELSPNRNSMVLTDNFLVNLLSRDSTAAEVNTEEKVLKSVENETTEDVAVECVEKDKTQIECEVILEQKVSDNMAIFNQVTSDKHEIATEEKKASTSGTVMNKSVDIFSGNVNANEVFSSDEMVEKENENHLTSVNGLLFENSTIRNSSCVSAAAELESKVIESVQENSMLSSNSVDSHNIESNVKVKETSIHEGPKSNNEQKPVENMSEAFCQSKYRCESDVWTDDEDDSSTSDSSSSDSDFFQDMCEKSKPKKLPFVKTKGELGLDDLPPIEELVISVNESEMTAIGKIYAIVEKLVVIRSMKGMKALDLDSVLFLSHDQPLGRIFDVFGPVTEPFYSVRFNSVDQINEKGVTVGVEVFFAPEKSDITTYVFVEELQNQKGSDASWKHNNEPPEEFLDYSDDEKEKNAKQQRRFKNRNRQFSNNADTPAKRPLLTENSSSYIPPPKPASQRNRSYNVPHRFSRPNPFQSHIPPPSPSPSVCNLMSPVRMQNSFRSSPNQPQRLAQPQNILYQSSPQFFVSPYQQPHHVFGQVAVFNPLSPALHGPSPLSSPVMNNIPSLIPASHFPAPQNYFNQTYSRSPSPVTHNQPMTPDPWLPNRSFNSANIPPSHPLTVQIPNMGSPSVPLHQFPGERGSVQQFVNIQNGNFNEPYVNRNFPPANIHPRYYHS